MRDVYAGDDDHTRARSEAPLSDVLFIIEADPDPDALSRIIGIVGLTNRAPASGHMVTGPSGQLNVTLEVQGIPLVTQDLIRRKLLQLTCVTAAEAHVVHRSPSPAHDDVSLE